MKKFKPNKITTFMFAMIEILSPFSVVIPLMMLLSGKENYTTNDILCVFPAFLLILVLIVVFCCLLNVLTLPFTQYTVFLFDDHFSRSDTKVKYDDITKIEIDSGLISRFGGNEPCCLDCYSGNELLISIEHPSLMIIFFLIRRCRNAKLRYKRVKKLILLWSFCLIIGVVLGLYGAP